MAQETKGAAAKTTAAPVEENKSTGAEPGVTPPATPTPTPPATTASGVTEDGNEVGPDAEAVAGLAGNDVEVKKFAPETPAATGLAGNDVEVKKFAPETPAATGLAPASADTVDTAKLERRTIKHALFYYSDVKNPRIERLAHRGETVELLPVDVERGELFDAFTTVVGAEPARFGRLPEFPIDSGLDQQKRWVASASADEIVTYAAALDDIDGPLQRRAILDAEQARGKDSRSVVITALSV